MRRSSCSGCRRARREHLGTRKKSLRTFHLLSICNRFAPGTSDLVVDTFALHPKKSKSTSVSPVGTSHMSTIGSDSPTATPTRTRSPAFTRVAPDAIRGFGDRCGRAQCCEENSGGHQRGWRALSPALSFGEPAAAVGLRRARTLVGNPAVQDQPPSRRSPRAVRLGAQLPRRTRVPNVRVASAIVRLEIRRRPPRPGRARGASWFRLRASRGNPSITPARYVRRSRLPLMPCARLCSAHSCSRA